MALNRIKDFPHMLNSLKNKKDSYLDMEIESDSILIWICNECGDKWREDVSIRFHFNNCPVCEERYKVSLEDCSFGGNRGRLCKEGNCYYCFMRSFASSVQASKWSKDNIGRARDMFKNTSAKYILLDCECGHTYEIRACNSSSGIGCSYCSNPPRKLCNKDDCMQCYNKSFASSEKSYQWSKNNSEKARDVFKGSSTKYILLDCECGHTYEITPRNSSNGVGCSYCSNPPRKLCNKDDCEQCHKNSFASHSVSEYWDYKLNKDITPRQVFKSSAAEYFFIHDCKHSFKKCLNGIVAAKIFCSFCSGKQLCSKEDCDPCYTKSFASSPMSKFWNTEKNKCTPREVFLNSNSKYYFTCDVCNHELYRTLRNDRWCKYCGNKELCLEADCKYCFERSFSSHEKIKYWAYDKNSVNPRNIHKCSSRKCWFNCKYHGHFHTSLNNVTNGRWCPLCTHKGEGILYEYLIGVYDDVEKQAIFSWCKSETTGRNYLYDFYIPSLNIIVEIDGLQHFKHIEHFKNDPEDARKRDVHKMKLALDNDISLIRILQEDVFYDRNDWKDSLKEVLYKYDIPTAIFIDDDNNTIYDNHIKDFSEYYGITT